MMIADVRPPVKERLAVAEHEIEDLNSLYATLYEMLIPAANAREVDANLAAVAHEANRRIDTVHKRLDTEVVPAIKELRDRRAIRDWATGVALAITIVYSIVLTVKHWP